MKFKTEFKLTEKEVIDALCDYILARRPELVRTDPTSPPRAFLVEVAIKRGIYSAIVEVTGETA